MAEYDVVVIGAGHNGLTCAAYLVKSGLRVCVLERRKIVGEAAVTEEIWPGYSVSRASYLPHLNERIVADLGLSARGLVTGTVEPQDFMPFPDGRYSSDTLRHRRPRMSLPGIQSATRRRTRSFRSS